MSNRTTDYREDAMEDARDTARDYIDEIVQMLIDDGEASTDLYNDYLNGDSYHHENHVDRYYDLADAAAVLDQLKEYEEDDSGLWEGLSPKRAIATQAAYSYGNAVLSMWQDLINHVNDPNTLPPLDDAIADLQSGSEGVSVETIKQMVLSVIADW